MLGWPIIIYREPPHGAERDETDRLASWDTGLHGLEWIDALCKRGEAKDLGGNGYPYRYLLTAAVLRRGMQRGVSGPGGDERARLHALSAKTQLLVEAWDLS